MGGVMKKYSDLESRLNNVAMMRLMEAGEKSLTTLSLLQQGQIGKAEPLRRRREAHSARMAPMSTKLAPYAETRTAGAEATKGERSNFLPIFFLDLGTRVSRAVARVKVRQTGAVGTGFLCAPGLFITNRHVLFSEEHARSARVEFDYTFEDGVQPSIFRLAPDECFVTSEIEDLDFVIVAIGEQLSGPQSDAAYFGFCPMSDNGMKHAIGEFANVIQHPQGEEKQVVLQDNLIVSRENNEGVEQSVLHYFADTEPGSSGSPVFNNAWQVIALHHWGIAVKDFPAVKGFDPNSVNQGVRISRIVKDIRSRLSTLPQHEALHMKRLIDVGAQATVVTAAARGGYLPQDISTKSAEGESSIMNSTTNSGTTKIIVPLEITVNLGQALSVAAMAPKSVLDTNPQGPESPPVEPSDNADEAEAALPKTGEGYRSDFLDRHIIPLPRITGLRADHIAPLRKPEDYPSAKEGELQFTHYSVIVNKTRRLPFLGACNVDGKSLFGINSKKKAYDYADKDEKIFRMRNAEGGYGWKTDRRIDRDFQTPDAWYSGKNKLLPRDGTNDKETFIAIADFDRGHMVRRTEPIWGAARDGAAANYQTFNVVNAAPQTPRFNQDKTRDPMDWEPGEERRSWYGLEVAILRAATDEDRKYNVFTGPIFDDDDPIYASGKLGKPPCQVPLAFWKVVAWEEGGVLKSLAMIASQTFTMKKNSGQESLSSASELFLLRDFLTTVRKVEAVTGIDFGDAVKDADILMGVRTAGLADMSIEDFAARFISTS